MNPDLPSRSRGSRADDGLPHPSIARDETETVYRGHREPTAPVGEECTATVDDRPLDHRYDLLSASPSGFEWSYHGSGPAQLAIALLAHALNDEVACDHYQRFKRDIVAELPEVGWTLHAADLDAWYEEVSADA